MTNIPAELLDASEITKRYFNRWPMQEKQFRDSKGPLNIHRIVGYGKRFENYDNMKEKYMKIKLEMNPKESKVIKKPEDCIKKLNDMKIRNLESRLLQFAMLIIFINLVF